MIYDIGNLICDMRKNKSGRFHHGAAAFMTVRSGKCIKKTPEVRGQGHLVKQNG